MEALGGLRVGQPIVAVLLAFVTCAQACRIPRPMGDYVREAELIVVANTRKGGKRGFDTIASVTEVVKGDPKAAGTAIVLGMTMSTADVRVPVPATNVTILLRKDWREQEQWPVLEAYTKPKETDAVRTLVGICRLPSERQQLLALRENALAGNAYHLAQLLADLRNMREPGNFDIMIALYDALAPAGQAKLVEIMARTGDPRAVPPLLKAMRSSDREVRTTAARRLSWDFPGAPGVTEAFENALTQKHLARAAARYLSKRRDDPALDKLRGMRDTPWTRAGRLWEAGDTKAARAAYLAIIEDGVKGGDELRSRVAKGRPNISAAEKERMVKALLRSAAAKLLPNASAAERERIRKALLPQLLAHARSDDYIFSNDVARILRELHHVECLKALLALVARVGSRRAAKPGRAPVLGALTWVISKTYAGIRSLARGSRVLPARQPRRTPMPSLYLPAARTATLGIRELGSEARQQAFARLTEGLGAGAVEVQDTRTRLFYLLALIWLGDEESLDELADVMPAPWRPTWTALSPLYPLADERDEGAFLVRLLAESTDLPHPAREWVIFCLGDRKEKRAVNVLTATLTHSRYWRLIGTTRDALIRIGGPEVENEMLKLMTHEDHSHVRGAATEVLFRVQGGRSRDLARRMLREDDFGVKREAMLHLGNVGTVDDLVLLLPYCDYWKASRATHYWAMSAVASIRERYNCDVNGPVVKNAAKW